MRYASVFDLSWVKDASGNKKPAGQLDGFIEIEIGHSKSFRVVGNQNGQMAGFCMEWLSGDGQARELQITDVKSGKTWQGMFLPGSQSITFGDEGEDSVVLVSTGEITET